MKTSTSLPHDKKLTIIFRVEPGCLGPDGNDHVEVFCKFAQKKVASIYSDFARWEIVPRHDKSLAEMQYNINNKKLSEDKVKRFLEMFDKNLDELEEHIQEEITLLIDQYLGRPV